MFQKRPSVLKQLSAALEDNPIWRDLATATTAVMNEIIDEPRWALSRLREAEVVQRGDWVDTPLGLGKVTYYRRQRTNIDAAANTYDFTDYLEVQVPGKGFVTLPVRVLHSRNTLVAQASNLGFDYFADTIQDDDYQRVVTYISTFWKHNGGNNFVDFMGFIKRMRLEIGQLWTESIGDPGLPSIGTEPANDKDFYKQFVSESEYLTPVWERLDFNPNLTLDQELAGAFYPTSHVELSYDVLDHPQVDKLELLTLFYKLAPIHLVMHRFNDTVNAEVDLHGALAPLLYTIQQSSISFTVDI